MHSTEMKEEIKNISLEHNVTKEAINELVYLVFKYIREIIRSADKEKEYYPSVRLFGIGIFFVSKNRQRRLKEYLKNAKLDEDNSNG